MILTIEYDQYCAVVCNLKTMMMKMEKTQRRYHVTLWLDLIDSKLMVKNPKALLF